MSGSRVTNRVKVIAVMGLAVVMFGCGGSTTPVVSAGSSVPSPSGSIFPCNTMTALNGSSFPPPTASAENRPPTNSDMAGFINAFAAYNRVSPSIVSVTPGSARVAYMPSTRMHWGLATFAPRPGSGISPGEENRSIGDAFVPPHNRLILVQPHSCPWAYLGTPSVPFPCPGREDLPLGVQHAWKLASPSPLDCAHAYTLPAPP